MAARGHEVSVVAGHPHYPEPRWGTSVIPYHEVRDGIGILRLPLWSGRGTTAARLRQELSFTTALASSLAFLGTPDVVVAVSPCFPALAPTMLNARLRRTPWVLWLQDILPDGAAVTGILDEGTVLRLGAWVTIHSRARFGPGPGVKSPEAIARRAAEWLSASR